MNRTHLDCIIFILMSAFVNSHAIMLSGGMEYSQFLTLTLAELTIVVAAAKSVNKDDDDGDDDDDERKDE